MLELAEHVEVSNKNAVGSTVEEEATASKEAVNFLFKQIVGCITDIASQAPPLYEIPGDMLDKDTADKDLIISQYKTIINQLQETNKEIITRQNKQMLTLKEQFEKLRACVDLRESSRQKLEIASLKIKSELIKFKHQVTEHEQKNEIKALHHSEDVHALQQLVQRLVSGETRDANVLSMSQGGSLFRNPNSPALMSDHNSRPHPRDHPLDNGLPLSLHSLFDSKLRTSSTKYSSRGMDMMDTDVVVSSGETSSAGSALRDLHEITRVHIPSELDKDVIVVDNKKPAREVYEIPRDIREKRDVRGVPELPRLYEGLRNGAFANHEGSLHIEDEGEEGDRKRLKTDAERQRTSKAQNSMRSTHPRSPHINAQTQSPRAQSPLQQHPNYHQFQLQGQRPANNTIKKLSNSSGSPPPPQVVKAEKEQHPASQGGAPPANGQKKEPSEIWASEVLLAFSQGTDSPTEATSPLNASGDLKRRLSTEDIPPPPNHNSLVVSGGIPNGHSDNSDDPHTALRRINDELSMRRSSGGFDEYSFSRSSGGMSMGPLSASGHKKRRGKLPETATSLLKRWLLEHQQHPYPTEEEKAGLATSTSLTLNQINNWFTNARRRILPKQKTPGSPPSSPPPSSGGPTMHHHQRSHDDNHEYDSHTPNTTNRNTNNNNGNNNGNNNNTHSHTNSNTPTSPTFTNYTPNSNNNNSIPHTNFNNTPSLQNPSAILSQLAHNNTISTPLMAQLTAQLAQRLSSNPSPSPSPRPVPTPSTTILSLSTKRSGELDLPTSSMEIKSSSEMDDTPTTAPHTISLSSTSSQKLDPTQRDSPISISSELQKQQTYQSKFHTSPLRISSPSPPVIKDSPLPTTATLVPTATLTTSPQSSSSASSSSTSTPSPFITPTLITPTIITPTPATLPANVPQNPTPSIISTPPRPPIFPSHPLFAQSPSPLSALAQLGVSVINSQPPLDPTPQPM